MTEAERITRALGGDWRHGAGLAPCPVCQPEGRRDQRALSLTDRDGRILAYCFKGGCRVLPLLRDRGLAEPRPGQDDPAGREVVRRREAADLARRLATAHRLFAEGGSCAGTPAETYLRARGLTRLRLDRMPDLRFHPSSPHGPTGRHLPALLAQVRRAPDDAALGLWRIFLRPDGSAKADVPSPKLGLGPVSGGAVRFGRPGEVLILAEGIETAGSVAQAARLPVWACLSTSGLRAVTLPPLPAAATIVVAADADEAGIAAAEALAARAEAEGRVAEVIRPRHDGADYNDELQGLAHA